MNGQQTGNLAQNGAPLRHQYISTEVFEPTLQTVATCGCNQHVSSMELTYRKHKIARYSNQHVGSHMPAQKWHGNIHAKIGDLSTDMIRYERHANSQTTSMIQHVHPPWFHLTQWDSRASSACKQPQNRQVMYNQHVSVHASGRVAP